MRLCETRRIEMYPSDRPQDVLRKITVHLRMRFDVIRGGAMMVWHPLCNQKIKRFLASELGSEHEVF